jgi:ABC-type branched-subunit amino acid transport system substrate-binding protein
LADIFISYSRSDRARVAPFAEALTGQGFTVWWDARIATGEDFDRAIDDAITQAKVILVVWSQASISSRWVKEEAEDGLSRECLIPIRIDDVTIPRGFRRIQAADFLAPDPQANPDVWRKLCSDIRILVEGERPAAHNRPTGIESGGKRKPAPLLSRRKVLAGATASSGLLVAFGFNRGLIPMPFAGPPPPADMTPTVIGIYPTDSFGPLQKRGLHLAMELAPPGVVLVDLQATIDKLKRRDAPEILSALEKLLATRNVLSVVGPSVTEFAGAVIDVIEKSRRTPAILLTTAGPRDAIGWSDTDLPVFRIGSGVDERATQFAELAKEAIRRGKNLVFLVEQTPNDSGTTYGELFFQAISKFLPDWARWVGEGKVLRINFDRGNSVASLTNLEKQDIFDRDNLILLLGVGGDFIAMAEGFYSASQPPRKAIMGGWMTAYAVSEQLKDKPVQTDRLFDISDVYEQSAASLRSETGARFRQSYGDLTPARRDEAITYDSGLVLVRSLTGAGGAATPQSLVERLRKDQFEGVSGPIEFGENGQNRGPAGGIAPLIIVRFDPATQKWNRLTIDQLLA